LRLGREDEASGVAPEVDLVEEMMGGVLPAVPFIRRVIYGWLAQSAEE